MSTASTPELRQLQRLAAQGNLSWLPPKERAVVILRLGWDRPAWTEMHSKTARVTYEPRSQMEVALALDLSQPYVSTLEREARHLLQTGIKTLAAA